jgi:ZIP family zinc transporter
MALLCLVTEELLVEAHEKRDTPWITAMFVVGLLAALLPDQSIGYRPGQRATARLGPSQ